jgi:hypothetical protein
MILYILQFTMNLIEIHQPVLIEIYILFFAKKIYFLVFVIVVHEANLSIENCNYMSSKIQSFN